MLKFANRLSGYFRRLFMFADRCLIWGSKNMGLSAIVVSVFALIFSFWGLARSLHWGAAQLGPLSSYLAAAATLTAVTVALRQSWQARKIADDAVEAARIRAEIDREFSHRRETTTQILEMWQKITKIQVDLIGFTTTYRMNKPAPGSQYLALLSLVADGRSAIYSAETITLKPPVIGELLLLNDAFKKFETALRKTDAETNNEYADRVMNAWAQVVIKQNKFPKLLRDHLPLLEGAELEGKRMAEMQDEILSKFLAGRDAAASLDTETNK